jgi:uncharacterized repeat protein (TIGR01451 family)
VTKIALIDLSIAKSVSPAGAAPGQAITYTLAFSNAGGGTASGVVITDTIPVSVTGTSAVSSGATITQVGGTRYVWNVQNLAPGQGGVITITGVLSSPLRVGVFTNTATIAGTEDGNPANNTSAVTVTMQNVAPVAADDSYSTYEDTVLTVAASGVLSNDTDANLDPLTAVLAGDVATGTLALKANGGFVYTPTLNFTGLVTFTYRASDTQALSNLATVTITVQLAADLSISKGSQRAGTSITYTIVVSNAGPSNANGAVVTDTFPAGVSSPGWNCTSAGGASCTVSGSGNISDTVNLPTGGVATYTVTGTLTVSGTIVNTATVIAPGGIPDPVPGNNQAVNSSSDRRPVYLPIILKGARS